MYFDILLYIGQIGEVAGIGEFIQIDNAIFRISIAEAAHNVRADKSGTSGN